MRIDAIHTSITQYYTRIIEYKNRWINYRPSKNKRAVLFKYKDDTFMIECNPLTIEDDIIKYIEENKL